VGWTLEQLMAHEKRNSLLGLPPAGASAAPAAPAPSDPAPPPPAPDYRRFTVWGKPVGKPRMSQRDKWQKRPCVLRYREFCDRCRAAAGELPTIPPARIKAVVFVPMPKSWPAKKKERLLGRGCRQKPDYDNLAKSLGDALFEEDATIYIGTTEKYWCLEGEECVEAEIWFEPLDS
jgi:Holliday junction resolvase RusA-like endonuclease